MADKIVPGNYITFCTNGVMDLGLVAGIILPGNIDNSPAKILQEFLVQNAIEDLTDPTAGNPWPAYVGYMPDGSKVKTDVVSVYDTPGIKDGRQMATGEVNEKYGIQIKVRSDDYLEGYKKAQALGDYLENVFRLTVTIDLITYRFQNISLQGPVLSLGVEKGSQDRRLFVINLLMTIEKVE